MSGGIFISYRREDSAGFAGRIYDRIASRLDRERVFFDVDNIDLGADFVRVLSEQVAECDALVAIIGRQWLAATDEENRRRLDDPNDFVRIEIETALQRDIPVIPVLVGGAVMPRAESLPETLKPLARRNGLEISHANFDSDSERLTKALAFVEDARLKREERASNARSRSAMWLLAAAGIVAVIGAAALYFARSGGLLQLPPPGQKVHGQRSDSGAATSPPTEDSATKSTTTSPTSNSPPPAPMTASTNGYTDPKDYPIQGIDVSKIQGDIDWSAVANSGVKFAWIKATEGVDYVDQRFQANWKGAKAAGVLRGAYHVVDWCHSPNEQMAWFEKNIPADPDALSPALDPGDMYKCGRSPVQPGVIADMKVMLESMEHYFDKPPIIYTPPSLHGAILSVGAFRDYPIWLLRWSEVPPSIGNGYRPWYLWQYTEQGVVDGIHHPVDRNAFYGTSQQWQDFLAAR